MYRFLLIALLIAASLFAQSKLADVEAAYNKLKEAEAKKDPEAVLEWARKTSAAARLVTSQPKPEAAEAADQWRRDTDYASQVDTYTEYSIQAQVAGGLPADKTIALTEALSQQNPKSQYLGLIFNIYLGALQKAGQGAKIVPASEARIANDPNNEDVLLVLADGYMTQKNPDKSIQYANRLTEVMKTKAKPEGASDADWDKRKNAMLARGYWTAGINYGSQNQYAECDKALRAALPLIQGQNELLGPALFYLGVANYNMAKPAKDKAMAAEAIRFSDQSSAIKSPFQAQAQKNALSIRREFLIK
jgi:hypothetical protein